MDEDSDWSSGGSGIHHTRPSDYGHSNHQQHRHSSFGPLSYGPFAGQHQSYPSWSTSKDHWGKGHVSSTTGTNSSRSTFEEVESLCLSRSSDSSYGHFPRHTNSSNNPPLHHHQQQQQQQQQLPYFPYGHGGPQGSGRHAAGGSFLGGRLLSRQSSTTSTSTSSGHVTEQLEKRSQSSGSAYNDDYMETLDPRQQFDLGDHTLLDGIFRRVLEWNSTHAALGAGRGRPVEGGAGGPGVEGRLGPGQGGVPFPQASPGHYLPSGLFTLGQYPSGAFPVLQESYRGQGSPDYGSTYFPPDAGSNTNSPSSGAKRALGDASPHFAHGRPVPGRRVADAAKDKTLSPSSDITHAKRRRDLIIPDEEEDFNFKRPPSRNSKTDTTSSSSKKDASKNTSAGFSSFSSKQASSESMLSSMSSLSQSQDNWLEQFNQGWREAQHAACRDKTYQGWTDPYGYAWRRSADPPPSSGIQNMSHNSFSLNNPLLNRGMSIDSIANYSAVTPPDYVPTFVQPQQLQNPAEMMLMNLGFGGGAEGFLPERFLKDWYNKISRAQQQQHQQQQQPGQYPASANTPTTRMPDSSASTGVNASNLSHPQSHSKFPPLGKPNLEDLRSASDLHRRFNPLNRALTVSSSVAGDNVPETPTGLLPPSLNNDSRTDMLKEYIEAYAQNMNSTADTRSMRMRQFATSRQKSLPSYLETLTEEDEGKVRNTGYKPQDRESRLQAFLREDSFSTGSKSEYTTSSGGTSNDQSLCGSESDSLSGSDHHAYFKRARQLALASRETPVTMVTTQPGLVVSRTLTLKMPNPEKRHARFATDAENEINSHHIKHRSRHSSRDNSLDRDKEHTVNSRSASRQNSPHRGKHLHPDSLSADGLLQPYDSNLIPPKTPTHKPRRPSSPHSVKSNSSKSSSKELRPKSPSHRPKSPNKHHRASSPHNTTRSPSHRSRSPRHFRAKSPVGEVRSNVTELNQTTSLTNDGLTYNSEMTVASVHEQSISQSYTDFSLENPGNRSKKLPLDHAPLDSADSKQQQSLFFSGQLSSFLQIIPNNRAESEDTMSEKVEPLVSKESLEVADIFQYTNIFNKDSKHESEYENGLLDTLAENTAETINGKDSLGQLEPAMISIVLEDVDGNLTSKADSVDSIEDAETQIQLQKLKQHLEKSGSNRIGTVRGNHEDLLHIPSRSSSISLSPIPQSPVTVIEVGLDNQQDSIDTEEGINGFRDINDAEDLNEAEILSEDTDPSEFPFTVEMGREQRRLSRHMIFSDSNSDKDEELDLSKSKGKADVSISADDGKVSPVMAFMPLSPLGSSHSSSPSVAIASTQISEASVQANSRMLSPIVLLSEEELLSVLVENDDGDELYLVSDQGTQCDLDANLIYEGRDKVTVDFCGAMECDMVEMAHKITQTNIVRYEMSSQTDRTLQSEIKGLCFDSNIIQYNSDHSPDLSPRTSPYFFQDHIFPYRENIKGVNFDFAVPTLPTHLSKVPSLHRDIYISRESASLMSNKHDSDISFHKTPPTLPNTPCFEAEFWEMLGIEKPDFLPTANFPAENVLTLRDLAARKQSLSQTSQQSFSPRYADSPLADYEVVQTLAQQRVQTSSPILCGHPPRTSPNMFLSPAQTSPATSSNSAAVSSSLRSSPVPCKAKSLGFDIIHTSPAASQSSLRLPSSTTDSTVKHFTHDSSMYKRLCPVKSSVLSLGQSLPSRCSPFLGFCKHPTSESCNELKFSQQKKFPVTVTQGQNAPKNELEQIQVHSCPVHIQNTVLHTDQDLKIFKPEDVNVKACCSHVKQFIKEISDEDIYLHNQQLHVPIHVSVLSFSVSDYRNIHKSSGTDSKALKSSFSPENNYVRVLPQTSPSTLAAGHVKDQDKDSTSAADPEKNNNQTKTDDKDICSKKNQSLENNEIEKRGVQQNYVSVPLTKSPKKDIFCKEEISSVDKANSLILKRFLFEPSSDSCESEASLQTLFKEDKGKSVECGIEVPVLRDTYCSLVHEANTCMVSLQSLSQKDKASETNLCIDSAQKPIEISKQVEHKYMELEICELEHQLSIDVKKSANAVECTISSNSEESVHSEEVLSHNGRAAQTDHPRANNVFKVERNTIGTVNLYGDEIKLEKTDLLTHNLVHPSKPSIVGSLNTEPACVLLNISRNNVMEEYYRDKCITDNVESVEQTMVNAGIEDRQVLQERMKKQLKLTGKCSAVDEPDVTTTGCEAVDSRRFSPKAINNASSLLLDFNKKSAVQSTYSKLPQSGIFESEREIIVDSMFTTSAISDSDDTGLDPLQDIAESTSDASSELSVILSSSNAEGLSVEYLVPGLPNNDEAGTPVNGEVSPAFSDIDQLGTPINSWTPVPENAEPINVTVMAGNESLKSKHDEVNEEHFPIITKGKFDDSERTIDKEGAFAIQLTENNQHTFSVHNNPFQALPLSPYSIRKRSQSIDSLGSLRVSYSGSLDNILDSLSDTADTKSRESDHVKHDHLEHETSEEEEVYLEQFHESLEGLPPKLLPPASAGQHLLLRSPVFRRLRKGLSSDSLNSLKANCSGSVDNILEAVDGGGNEEWQEDVTDSDDEENIEERKILNTDDEEDLEERKILNTLEETGSHRHSAVLNLDCHEITVSPKDAKAEQIGTQCIFTQNLLETDWADANLLQSKNNRVSDCDFYENDQRNLIQSKSNSEVFFSIGDTRLQKTISPEPAGATTVLPVRSSAYNAKDQYLEDETKLYLTAVSEEEKKDDNLDAASEDSSSSNTSELFDLTDAKLTHLLLLGMHHPDVQRLRQLALSSFESSPSFTTPEDEIDCDQDPETDMKNAQTSNALLTSSASITQHIAESNSLLAERNLRGYLSNISEEDGSFEQVYEKAVDIMKYENHLNGYERSSEIFEKHQSMKSHDDVDTVDRLKLQQFLSDPLDPRNESSDDYKAFLNRRTVHTQDGFASVPPCCTHFDDNEIETTSLTPKQRLCLSVATTESPQYTSFLHTNHPKPKPSVFLQKSGQNDVLNDNQFRPISGFMQSNVAEMEDEVKSGYPYFHVIKTQNQIRSELHLSLHPLQQERVEECRPQPFSAAQRREAYNRLTAEFDSSLSNSEENPSASMNITTLPNKEIKRSLNSNQLLSPTKKEIDSDSSSYSKPKISLSPGSLKVPSMDVSLVSKNKLSRSHSPPTLAVPSQPRCQSPIPDSNASSRAQSPSPVYSPSSSPFHFSGPTVLLTPPQGNSPDARSREVSSPHRSPVRDVTGTTLGNSKVLLSFSHQKPKDSFGSDSSLTKRYAMKAQSHSCVYTLNDDDKDCMDQQISFQPESGDIMHITSHISNCSLTGSETATDKIEKYKEANVVVLESASVDASLFIDQTEKQVKGREKFHSKKGLTSALTKYHARKYNESLSSPDVSRKPKMTTRAKTLSSSGDESKPVQLSVNQTAFSSLSAESCGRLFSVADSRHSSSVDSSSPESLSVSSNHSSTSDSISSIKDSQNKNKCTPEGNLKNSMIECVYSAEQQERLCASPSPVTHAFSVSCSVSSQEDTQLEECDSDNDKPPPIPRDFAPSLYMKRSRFQRPHSMFSLHQNSNNTDKSSSATQKTSPRRHFIWSSGQKTVVSLNKDNQEEPLGEEPSPHLSKDKSKHSISIDLTDTIATTFGNMGDLKADRTDQSIQHTEPDNRALSPPSTGSPSYGSHNLTLSSRMSPLSVMSPQSLEEHSFSHQKSEVIVENDCLIRPRSENRVKTVLPVSPWSSQIKVEKSAIINALSPTRSVKELAKRFESKV